MRFDASGGEALADLRQILFRSNASIFAIKTYSKPKSRRTGPFTRVNSATFSPLARKFLDERKPLKHTYPNGPTLKTVENARQSSARRVSTVRPTPATASCLAAFDSYDRKECSQHKRATRAINEASKVGRSLLGQGFQHLGETRRHSEFEGHGVCPRSRRIWDKAYPALQNDSTVSDKSTVTGRKGLKRNSTDGKGHGCKSTDGKELVQEQKSTHTNGKEAERTFTSGHEKGLENSFTNEKSLERKPTDGSNDQILQRKSSDGIKDLKRKSTDPKLTGKGFDATAKLVDGISRSEAKLLAFQQSGLQGKDPSKKLSLQERTDGKKPSLTSRDAEKDKKDPVAQFRKTDANVKQVLDANVKQRQLDAKDYGANRKAIDRVLGTTETQTEKRPIVRIISTPGNCMEQGRTLMINEKLLSNRRRAFKSSLQHQQEVVHRKTFAEKDLNQQQAPHEGELSPLHKRRKGKLASKLVKTIWGPTPKKQPGEDEEEEAQAHELIKKIRRRKEEAAKKSVECLMDVLFKNWIYFQHAHTFLNYNSEKKDVHAKYCEGAFGHYLLSDGSQVHGSYDISLRQLISELKSLMLKLKGKLSKSNYKEAPKWIPPNLEQLPEFSAPEQPPMPKLYPIHGLTPLPEDEIPPDATMPLLRTPRLQEHPAYITPKLQKKPVASVSLDLPPLPDFSQEEKLLAKPPTDIPIPSFQMPKLLPLPTWEEPKQEPLPPRPLNEVAKVMEQLEAEVIPPYEPPKLELRPCEASYYYGAAEEGRIPICDGLCGRLMAPKRTHRGNNEDEESVKDSAPCLAKRPKLLPIPSLPINDEELLEPPFVPASLEPLPPFIPPELKPEPEYKGPPNTNVPLWNPPPPPLPIGYLAGQRPVFLIDCSSSMAGDRMVAAQDAIRHLFSRGGQVEIAATHFDIIMFSFDAWSFGAQMEEEKQSQTYGGASRHWVKNLELMQATTHDNMENALQWLSRWGTSGTSNLMRAIKVAMARMSADCIYLITHGKCDRPVIIMNDLKELEMSQRLTPIFPVGIECTKAQARILKSVLADITGGQLIELGLKWQFELYHSQKEASEDEKWLQSKLEFWQRKSMLDPQLAANPHRIEIILDHLKWQFEHKIIAPRLASYHREDQKARMDHHFALERVRAENDHILSMAHNAYEKTHSIILGQNKCRSEDASLAYEKEIKCIRESNLERRELHRVWKQKIQQSKEANHKAEEEGRLQFLEDVRCIEERNLKTDLQGKDEHESLVQRLKEQNDRRVTSHQRQQEALLSHTKAQHSVIWKAYEEQCTAITECNAQNAKKAREEYIAACKAVIKGNHERMRDAEADYKEKIENITAENTKKKAEHMAKVEALEARKCEARKVHHDLFAKKVAEHKASLANIAIINNNLELEAKQVWEEACKVIDVENKNITTKAYQEWRDAAHQIQLQNEQLARRRMDLQLRRDEVERMNTELIRKKKLDWKNMCQRLELSIYEEATRAKLHYKQLERELQARNEQTLEVAKQAFEAKKQAIDAYNKSIRPQMEASEAVQQEIDKIREFLGYIVKQSHLPLEKKHAKKRTLEQSLDMLAALDSPCPPKMVIAALQSALASEMTRLKSQGKAAEDLTASVIATLKANIVQQPQLEQHLEQQRRLSKPGQGKFTNMVPIEPPRVTPHSCNVGRQLNADLREFLLYHKPNIGMGLNVVHLQQEEGSATSLTESASTSMSRSASLSQTQSRASSRSMSRAQSVSQTSQLQS